MQISHTHSHVIGWSRQQVRMYSNDEARTPLSLMTLHDARDLNMKEKKVKEADLYSALKYLTFKALRYRSHSVTCKLHVPASTS